MEAVEYPQTVAVVSGQNEVPHDDAARHHSVAKTAWPRLFEHLFDRRKRAGEIAGRGRISSREFIVKIFQVGQVHVHVPAQRVDCLDVFVASAVEHDGQ